MAHKDPLQIPEIADVVASFLEPQDLASCICVSKSWWDAFLRHRWQVIVSGCKDPYLATQHTPHLFGPHPDVVFHHRQLIQDLTLVKAVAPFVKHQYPNVRRLAINFSGAPQFLREPVSLELKDTFPSLVQLTLMMVNMTPESWKILEKHPQIKTLQLMGVRIAPTRAEAFWKVVENMENLEMVHCLFSDIHEKLQKDVKFLRMRKLTVHVVWWDYTLFEMIARCPRLEEVAWVQSHDLPVSVDPLQHACWPHLEKLSIEFPLQDDELASLLQRVGNGQEKAVQLKLVDCSLGADTSAALIPHFDTLVKVNIADCASVPSTTTRDLLCHCPRLEVLESRNVMAKDIVAGGPWICQQLRKLAVCFRFEESEKSLQQVIFERLSMLIRLEELIMHIPKNNATTGELLEFRLDYGMGQLASLRQLTALRFLSKKSRDYHARLGTDEFDWIKDHWKKLKTLEGRLNSDHEVDGQLKRAFKAHGISVEY